MRDCQRSSTKSKRYCAFIPITASNHLQRRRHFSTLIFLSIVVRPKANPNLRRKQAVLIYQRARNTSAHIDRIVLAKLKISIPSAALVPDPPELPDEPALRW